MSKNEEYVLVKIKEGLVNGLKTYYFIWSGDKPPDDLLSQKAIREDVSPWINYVWWDNPAPGIPSEFYAIAWIGFLEIDKPGMYRFYVTTDDGSRLWVNDKLVIDAWKDQPPTTYISDPIYLSRGYHKIRYYYYNKYGFGEAVLGWIPPEKEPSIIPKDKLFHCLGTDVFFTNMPDDYVIEVMPVDAEKKTCRSYEGICRVSYPLEKFPLEAIIRIYDERGRLIYESREKTLIWGGDEFRLVRIKK